MITLEKVNERTFQIVTRMNLSPEQNKFVAPNIVSLAQAWLYYDNARPLAIMEDGEPVGFMMLDWDEGERTLGLWRFMIATDKQGNGRGRRAIEILISDAKSSGLFDMMRLDYVQGNDRARALYYSLGFRENGDVEDGEIIMTLPLNDSPKLGHLIADMDDCEEIAELVQAEKELGAKMPAWLSDIDGIKALIGAERLIRLTLMGDTVGVALKGEKEFLLAHEHSDRFGEACSILEL
ncbi:MAG: GNAT family N-acetyltransferase [Eubacteriales bacterium]|nr:GNAT family N-acetyltransferase [Eubacteriales bacterium]MDD3883141.1 GNAT family N-acetyltransferase [Eubacteriales bacterium]MDD4512689.1 GNAT family N-acetyltransferase [Eubacteriales bacterium]